VLSNSLGANLAMWDRQVAALAGSFNILRYDSRGHGRSTATPGPYSIDTLARDLLGLLDELKVARVHFGGLSLGGMVGMWLAGHEPARFDRLVLANTSALLGSADGWNTRIESVQRGGMAAIANAVMDRWFTPAFQGRFPAEVESVRQMLLEASPDGYAACCAAVRDMDQRAGLPSIRARTLVIAGTDDPATPPPMVRKLADGITGAQFCELRAAHLSNIEAAGDFNAAMLNFLTAE
jgi:3-oxoadipate enol-lactonase